MKKRCVVIVLGLGETKNSYTWLTKSWQKKYNITPYIHIIGWKEKQRDFEKRLPLLVNKIKDLMRQKYTVSIIGISAGASASINAYFELKRKNSPLNGKVVLLCGRFNFDYHFWYPTSLGVKPYPAFEQSVAQAQNNLKKLLDVDKKNMYIFRAILDEVVPSSASSINGINTSIFPFPTHFFGIPTIFLFSKKLVGILKST